MNLECRPHVSKESKEVKSDQFARQKESDGGVRARAIQPASQPASYFLSGPQPVAVGMAKLKSK